MSRIMWALAFGILLVAGQTYAEKPPFRETARVVLTPQRWVSQDGQWRHPAELVGMRRIWTDDEPGDDIDVATTQIWISQDGNMGAGSSYNTGEAPGAWGATDILLFDGVASQVSPSSGLDLSAITVARIDVTDNFTGDIGLPGTPFQIASISNVITMRGSGTLHFSSAGGDEIFVDSPNHLNAVSIPSGIITGLFVKEGHVDVGASTVFAAATLATFGPYATVTVAGSANTAPWYIDCWDGVIDPGLRGPSVTAARPSIHVGGGLLKLHRLTGAANYTLLQQTGGVIDFDILEANGVAIIMQLAGGTADFRKSQYVFGNVTGASYIGPAAQIIPGPATTEAILTASGIHDFRKNFP